MATAQKERNFLFDTFRGLLIWTIPISHFTRVGGDFSQASLNGIVYITINVFVMQAFVFLSGYFSKKPERARETAFKTFLFPYLVLTPMFYVVRYVIFGNAHLQFIVPPLALWYLVALFFYRFFLKDFIRIRQIVPVCIAVYLLAGLVPFFDETLALGRMVSYFPFFMLGFYCTKEHIEKIQKLKIWLCIPLAAVLIAVSCILAFYVNVPVDFYLLKSPATEIGMVWYVDILMRMLVLCLACGWIVLMLNILPKSNNYLTYVGKNTMPVYILHLVIRYLIKKYGIYTGNTVVYYLIIYALASVCVIVFSSPPVAKAYNAFMDFLYNLYFKIKSFVLVK